MYQSSSALKKISLMLGITTLLLGLVPVPVFARVGMVSADDGGVVEPPPEEPMAEVLPADESLVEEPPAEEPLVEEPPLEEPLAEEPPAKEPPAKEPPADEPPADEPPADEPPAEEPLVVESPVEDPLPSEEELVDQGEFAPMLSLMAIGDDPDVANEIPVPGNYNNGLCNSNPLYCVDADPVTNPNDYTDEGTYGSKTYDIPEINGIQAEIVVIKSGNDYFFFKNGSSATCFEDTFCVEFDGTKVHIYSYQTQGNPNDPFFKGYNLINFWVTGLPEGEIPGCTDRTALNFNPEATLDDGSCEFDEPGGGGGGNPGGGDGGNPGGGGSGGGLPLLIPVTGADLDGGFAHYRIWMVLAGSALLTSGLLMKRTAKKEEKQKI